MSKMLNTAQAAIEWVTDTRQRAARLDDEADALLAQLTLAAVNREDALGFTDIRNRQKRTCSQHCAATPMAK